MSKPERLFELATKVLRQRLDQGTQLAKRKRKRRMLRRMLKGFLAMMVVTFVIVPAMIASGFLFGPRGTEGLIAAPVVLFSAWAVVLYWTFGRKPRPRLVGKSDLPQLPAHTEEWIELERAGLPAAAQGSLDSITQQLEALTPQLAALDAQSPGATELRRLLGEELPELVRGYRKVPPALATQPLYGGPSPERQLIEGLETIDKQVARVHERLAADDLHALATHNRYLELKYKPDDDKQ